MRRITLFITLGVTAVLIGGSVNQASQDTIKERAISIEKHANAPIEFDDLSLSVQSIKDRLQTTKKNAKAELKEVKIKAADNWMKDFHIRIRNVSNKTITAVSLEWWITHPALDLPLIIKMTRNLRGGRVLAANDELVIDSGEKEYNQATHFIQSKGGTDSVTTATLKLDQVEFEDGTRWRLGSLFRRDPVDPKLWIKIQATGRIGNNVRKYSNSKPKDKTIGPLVRFSPAG